MMGCKSEWPSFVCDGCGKKAVLTYDEFIVRGEGLRLCTDCVGKLLDTERVFIEHVPGCVDAAHHMMFYTTWVDLDGQLRKYKLCMAGHLIGCSDVTKRTASLLEVFDSDKGVQWWVIGTAYNIPEKPPWPDWKKVVRKLGGRV